MNFIEQLQQYQPIHTQEITDKRAMSWMIQQFPDTILFRENPIAHMTASGFIVNREYTKTLMIHHNLYNSWGWTGGHADGNCNLLQVAIKEAKEETGVSGIEPLTPNLVSIDILPVFSHEKHATFVNTHLHFCYSYLLLADETAPLHHKPDENSGVKWIPLNQISHYCHESHMLPIYQKLIEKVEFYTHE